MMHLILQTMEIFISCSYESSIYEKQYVDCSYPSKGSEGEGVVGVYIYTSKEGRWGEGAPAENVL